LHSFGKKENMVGQRIKTLRAKKGISQEYLAEQLGLTQSTLARIEQGKTKLAASLLPTVCKTLDVDLEDIFSTEKVCIENNTFNELALIQGEKAPSFQSYLTLTIRSSWLTPRSLLNPKSALAGIHSWLRKGLKKVEGLLSSSAK
jgi:transcriptional regulator with XRE-family HTH domain